VVDTSQGIEPARQQVQAILAAVAKMRPANRRTGVYRHHMLREIVFDTETTGLDPATGDRLVEIGCIEMINRFPTGNTFHCYFNPERDMPKPAFDVHGLSAEFLTDKPLFAHKADELVAFIGDAALVAHNAMFDLTFLNAELERAGKALVSRERLVDTLMLARRKFPARRTGSTTCARATASTIRSASSTARCSTPSCWPRSISS
jgi:DNA polymerase-3 subunit epsilon